MTPSLRRWTRAGIAAAVAVLVTSSVALAASGDLDQGFGGGGRVTTVFGAQPSAASAVVVQPDWKIVAVGSRADGSFVLARYRGDGTLDPTFGGDGRVTTPISPYSSAYDVAIQADGKILVVGRDFHRGAFALVRYRPNGTLDRTFGDDGKVTTRFGSGAIAQAVAIQDNGKILAAGLMFPGCGGDDSVFALARYRPDGTLDPTFGDGGRVTTTITTCLDDTAISALAIQDDGKIVAAGSGHSDPSGPFSLMLARYGRGGGLDATFGTQGIVITPVGDYTSAASDVALQTDGKIVAAGFSQQGAPGQVEPRFAVVRYDSGGELDPTFGGDGQVTTQFRRGRASASGMAIQGDGKIVAAGETCAHHLCVFALARYTAEGSRDPTLGGDGKVTTGFGIGSAGASDLALQANGKIVAAGDAGDRFSLARYLP
jgi:uncharacterized delta-60 repeat protein